MESLFYPAAGAAFFLLQALPGAEQWLDRYGTALILVNRFLSGIRSVIAIAAGIGGMGWKKVVLCGLVSMGVWNGMLLYAGVLVGRNWGRIVEYLGYYNRFFCFARSGNPGVFSLAQMAQAKDRQRLDNAVNWN